MKSPLSNTVKSLLGLFVFALTLSPVFAVAGGPADGQGVLLAKMTPDTVVSEAAPPELDLTNPKVKAVKAVQGRHSAYLMRMPEVVGVGIGLDNADEPGIVVFTRTEPPFGVIPETLEGVHVVVKPSGEFKAMPKSGGSSVSTTAVWPRPVPIGVSTGNPGECLAGTISARVKSGTSYYALSNNHVYALENAAHIGDLVIQPGLYDLQCTPNWQSYEIGMLSAFVPISFTGTNTVDAAIAYSSPSALGKATPSNGYGAPSSTTLAASIGMPVQKYGRTTQLTRGTVYTINTTVVVGYSSGNATFTNQITVTSSKPFIKPGDSGSLLVTGDTNANPVGLLFAGSNTGTYAIANPIDLVLSSFGVSIDGK